MYCYGLLLIGAVHIHVKPVFLSDFIVEIKLFLIPIVGIVFDPVNIWEEMPVRTDDVEIHNRSTGTGNLRCFPDPKRQSQFNYKTYLDFYAVKLV